MGARLLGIFSVLQAANGQQPRLCNWGLPTCMWPCRSAARGWAQQPRRPPGCAAWLLRGASVDRVLLLPSAAGWPLPRRLHADKVSVVNSLWPMDCLVEGRLLPAGAGLPRACAVRFHTHAPALVVVLRVLRSRVACACC